jgi:hypothetical protein
MVLSQGLIEQQAPRRDEFACAQSYGAVSSGKLMVRRRAMQVARSM